MNRFTDHKATELSELPKYAVKIRHPGDAATVEDTEHSMYICDEIRQAVRTHLKLPEK